MTSPIAAVNYDRRHLASLAPVAASRQKRARTLLRTLGRRWGWIDSRDERRMHLLTLGDGPMDLPVSLVLEQRGVRKIELTGLVGLDEYGDIKSLVAANRQRIEQAWVRHMVERGWLQAVVVNDRVFLVANPDSENAYRRVIDLRDLDGERLPEADPQIRFDLEGVALVIEGCSIRPMRIDLARVLFRDSWFTGEDA